MICTSEEIPEENSECRSDEDILAEIWDALWKEGTIRSLEMGSLSINVKDGEVTLNGHLAKENHQSMIIKIARSAAGVVAVHNDLVVDRDLINQVAQIMANDERTRPFITSVSAAHGWISLGGEVPTGELQHVAEKVAGAIPGVRGVITLPRVSGGSEIKAQCTMQPQTGALVYGERGEAGVITKLVISPNNRLVTHVVVQTTKLVDGNLLYVENVLPVNVLRVVNNESIFLAQSGKPINTYPLFDAHNYPLAPSTWKPPYPYTRAKFFGHFEMSRRRGKV